jgi:hypothetical protein
MTSRIAAARTEVAETREALIDTARELQQRLQPKTLAREAWESAKVKGADMAEDAVDAVKRRPVATGGIIAAIAMFLAREPIKDGVGKLYDAMTSKDKPAPKDPPAPRPAPRRTRTAPTARRKTEKK